MAQQETGKDGRIGAPPIPHEHGAWMMLYAPLAIGLVVFRPVPLWPALWLVLAITGAFMAQNAVGLLLRRRVPQGAGFWLAVYAGICALAGGYLLLGYGLTELLWLGIPPLLLFGGQGWLRRSANWRLNRSQLGEVAAVGVFALTGPAAHIVAHGELAEPAWAVWGSCVLFFTSSVFYVRMRVEGARFKGGLGLKERWQAGRGLVVYHLSLAIALIFWMGKGDGGGLPIVIAFFPALIRALGGFVWLPNRLPSLRRIGLLEIAYSLWFCVWLMAGLPAA
jgi:hypothetical protein